MARKKFLCDSCGLYNKSKKEYEMCMPCRLKVNHENRDINICSCGNTMYKESKICWECLIKNKKSKAGTVCPQCKICIIKNQDANICINCYREKIKARSGENHPLYRFDKKKCGICGVNIKDTNTLCKKCHVATHKGEKCYNWDKEKTMEERINRRSAPENREWSIKCLKKDDFICQKCGVRNGTKNAHHIFNYKKYEIGRFDEDNGITLCVSCHKDFHKKHGNKNNDLTQLLHFLNTNTSNIGIFTNN